VIACLGGEVPAEFLKKSGVTMRRLQGEELVARAARGSAKRDELERSQRRFASILFVIGATIVALLSLKGWAYYQLPAAERVKDAAHAALRPSGPWGHGVGIVATLFMMSNFLYAVRKRWSLLKGTGSIRKWLTFHHFVGFMSPLVIAFHATFRSNNTLATATTVSLAIVVATGVIRHTFGELRQLQTQVTFYGSIKLFLSVWRVFHVVLAILLVVMITAHIGVSLFLGYTWIFR
jgi:hypothetical protein